MECFKKEAICECLKHFTHFLLNKPLRKESREKVVNLNVIQMAKKLRHKHE